MDLKKAADNAPNNYDAKTDYDIAYETFNRAISANAAMTPSFLPLLPGHGGHQGLIQGALPTRDTELPIGAPRRARVSIVNADRLAAGARDNAHKPVRARTRFRLSKTRPRYYRQRSLVAFDCDGFCLHRTLGRLPPPYRFRKSQR